MPFDGAGNFSRLYNWQSDRDNGIHILAARMDGEFDNFAAGMNVVFFRNGLVPMSGNLNLGQNYIVGIGAGSVNALPIRFADDPNSGIFLNGLNRPSLVANSVTRLEANTNGVIVTGTSTLNGNTSVAGTFGTTGLATLSGASSEKLRLTGSASPFISGYGANGTTRQGYLQFNPTDTTLGCDAGAVNLRPGASVALAASSTAVNSLVPLQQQGNNVWHSGNFTPENYAKLSGAAFTGNVTAPLFGIDANYKMYLANGNPALLLDGNDDFQVYDRTNNQYNWYIALTKVAALTGSGLFLMTGGINTTGLSTLSGSGSEKLRLASDSSPYISGFNAAQTTRQGYIQFAPTQTNVASDGGVVNLLTNASTRLAVSNTAVNSLVALQQSGNQVWHAGNFNPGNYATLAGANFNGSVNVPVLNAGVPFIDAYTITASGPTDARIATKINGTIKGIFQSTSTVGVNISTPTTDPVNISVGSNIKLSATTTGVAVTGALSATGAITQAGNQVWHAGNFNPSDYAALATGPTFNGDVSVNDATPTFAGYSADHSSRYGYLLFANTGTDLNSDTGILRLVTGSTTRATVSSFGIAVTGAISTTGAVTATGAITQGGNQVWHAGNLNPAIYASLAGAAFTGSVSFGNSSTFNVNLSAGNPVITFDTGDTLTFDRTNNKFIFGIGSQQVASIDASGNLRVKGNVMAAQTSI